MNGANEARRGQNSYASSQPVDLQRLELINHHVSNDCKNGYVPEPTSHVPTGKVVLNELPNHVLACVDRD
jgi:hypothetical protein